jgi:hypothetical protein
MLRGPQNKNCTSYGARAIKPAMWKNSVVSNGHGRVVGYTRSNAVKKRMPASYQQRDCGRGDEGRDSGTVLTHNVFRFDLHENDVLLGRGTGPNTSVGNVRFREIVWETFQAHLSAKSSASTSSLKQNATDEKTEENAVPHDEPTCKKDVDKEGMTEPLSFDSRTKNEVAFKVLSKFQQAGQGRFLRKLTKAETASVDDEAKKHHQSDMVLLRTKNGLYEEVSGKEVLEKIKQTLRFQIEDHERRRAVFPEKRKTWSTASPDAKKKPVTSSKPFVKVATESDIKKKSKPELGVARHIGSVLPTGAGGCHLRAGIESRGLFTRADLRGLVYNPIVLPSLIPAALIVPASTPRPFAAQHQSLLPFAILESSMGQQPFAASAYFDEFHPSLNGGSLLSFACRLNDPLWMTTARPPELRGSPNLPPCRNPQQVCDGVGRIDSALARLLLIRRRLEEVEEERARVVLLRHLTGPRHS